jgi:hypothetical protein
MIQPGAVSFVQSVDSGENVIADRRLASAGPALMPRAADVTKAADAAVLSFLENESAMKRRLMDLALPKPFKKRPINTNKIELQCRASEHCTLRQK